jgi:hypothetical protein
MSHADRWGLTRNGYARVTVPCQKTHAAVRHGFPSLPSVACHDLLALRFRVASTT